MLQILTLYLPAFTFLFGDEEFWVLFYSIYSPTNYNSVEVSKPLTSSNNQMVTVRL